MDTTYVDIADHDSGAAAGAGLRSPFCSPCCSPFCSCGSVGTVRFVDPLIFVVAFAFGFCAQRARLPPLVGYLAAGFVLNGLDYEITPAIEAVSDLGVLLLLFGIGLKLKPTTLARPVVWAGTTVHMAFTTVLVGSALLSFGRLGLPIARDLDVPGALLVGFAFSFSSTVFAVKALDERNEAASLQGRLAIGFLVVQDLFAVVFLTVAVDERPSPWAVVVVAGIVVARPVYGWLLERSGRGELQLLFAVALAVGVGAEAFGRVGLKPDLGALVIGFLLANHPRAGELADTLLGLKDMLLIGFFLSIGLAGLPDLGAMLVAAVVLGLLVFKTLGYLWLISRFRFRVRTSWHTASMLATYSEFGLIVAVVGVEQDLLDARWTSAIAVVVAMSFAIAAPLNERRFDLYRMLSGRLRGFQRTPVQSDDALIEPTDARVLVFGMGRVGAGAYDGLVAERGPVVLGVDRRDATVENNLAVGRNTIRGDALDSEFWARLQLHREIDVVILAMSDHEANVEAIHQVRAFRPHVALVATATFPDDAEELRRAGASVVKNLYDEAGQGLADDAVRLLGQPGPGD
jgi:glutathione-regulated potassium-efflux system ancillary protein KefC